MYEKECFLSRETASSALGEGEPSDGKRKKTMGNKALQVVSYAVGRGDCRGRLRLENEAILPRMELSAG